MCGSVRFGLRFSLMIEMFYHYFENLDEVSATVWEAENEKLLIQPLEGSSELLIAVLFLFPCHTFNLL